MARRLHAICAANLGGRDSLMLSWFAPLPPPTVWMLIHGAVGFGSGVETYGACKETIP